MQHIKSLLTGAFLLIAVTMSASVGGTLTVTTLDGNKQAIDLTAKPVITMNESELVIKLTDSELRFNTQQVVDFRYSDITGADVATIAPQAMQQRGDQLRFTADNASLKVRIANITGIVLDSFEVPAGSNESVSIGNFASGIYLVTVNGVTYKIIKP